MHHNAYFITWEIYRSSNSWFLFDIEIELFLANVIDTKIDRISIPNELIETSRIQRIRTEVIHTYKIQSKNNRSKLNHVDFIEDTK